MYTLIRQNYFLLKKETFLKQKNIFIIELLNKLKLFWGIIIVSEIMYKKSFGEKFQTSEGKYCFDF